MAFVCSCCRPPFFFPFSFVCFLFLPPSSSYSFSVPFFPFLLNVRHFFSSSFFLFFFVAHRVLLTVLLSIDVVVVIQCFVVFLPLNRLPSLLSSPPLILSSFDSASPVLSPAPPVSSCLCLNTITHTYIHIHTYVLREALSPPLTASIPHTHSNLSMDLRNPLYSSTSKPSTMTGHIGNSS